ncbi:MAG: DNA binding domain-containing protein [Candidatus Magnetoglobus multicellularis str. Araruama]|uniref:DNA binding domain-containing protein n=1 Tax=Candidatus Magnetoglobus multicellularis str. Araruama TaxID=890399 RepID=A0A1V1P9C5_9BACT|nr:MAG: DNA binding domain-containing protein [Candidatus Magnetoglobus multicellularis str. Araruama]
MKERPFLSTKEVAQFLDITEKMVYSLVSEKGLPATKITGKWLFPLRYVEQWLEENIINVPRSAKLQPSDGLLVISGSHDLLLDKTIAMFNRTQNDCLAVFGNVGSLGGIQSLGKNLCHLAASHLLQEDDNEYNFDFIYREMGGEQAVVVNFCRREQGFIVPKDNPKHFKDISDLQTKDFILANRGESTGTRHLLDRSLTQAGIDPKDIKGYDSFYQSHLDVAIAVLSGRADIALAIHPVADLLGLDFIPLRWERYDLLISKARFFEKGIQVFLNMLNEPPFQNEAQKLKGYDISRSGKIIFPKHNDPSDKE